MTEQFKNSLNQPTTLLDGDIGAANVALDVTAGTGVLCPATGDFRIRIDNEFIIVGSRTTDTLSSLTRGAEGSTAAAHLDGAAVNLILTAGALEAGFGTVAQAAALEAKVGSGVDAPATGEFLKGTATGVSAWSALTAGEVNTALGYTAADDQDLTDHAAAADPHAGYVLESLIDAKGDLIVGTADNTVARKAAGANDTILMYDSAQADGLKAVGSQTPSTQAFADAAAEGTADTYSRGDHKHAWPADPVTAHAAAGDPHTGYQKESEKDQLSGYPGLTAAGFVLPGKLGSGTPDGTKYLRDDGVWNLPPGVSPTTTRGDIIKRGAAGDERLAIGTLGQALRVVDIGAGVLEPRYADKASGGANGSSSGPTTTSTTYVDLTDMSVTLTISSGILLAMFSGTFSNSGVNGNHFAFSLDGAAEVGIQTFKGPVATDNYASSLCFRWSGLSVGSHTVKVRWKVAAGTGTGFTTQRNMVVWEG